MKNKKLIIIKRLSFLITMMMVFISCNTLNQGVIVEKWYELPKLKKLSKDETTYFNNQRYTHNVNYIIKDGEDFCIKIKGLNQNKREKFRTIYLRRECWDSAHVGQDFCITSKCFTYDFTLDTAPENSFWWDFRNSCIFLW